MLKRYATTWAVLGVALVVWALDLITKIWAVSALEGRDPVYLIGDWARLLVLRNSGAAFSMATGYTWVLTLVALGVVIAIIRLSQRLRSAWWTLGLGLVLGGALGNLVPGETLSLVYANGQFDTAHAGNAKAVSGTVALAGFATDGSRFRVRNEFLRADGELAARVTSTGGFLNLDTRRLTAPPQSLLAIYQSLPRTDDYQDLPSSLKPKAS